MLAPLCAFCCLGARRLGGCNGLFGSRTNKRSSLCQQLRLRQTLGGEGKRRKKDCAESDSLGYGTAIGALEERHPRDPF